MIAKDGQIHAADYSSGNPSCLDEPEPSPTPGPTPGPSLTPSPAPTPTPTLNPLQEQQRNTRQLARHLRVFGRALARWNRNHLDSAKRQATIAAWPDVVQHFEDGAPNVLTRFEGRDQEWLLTRFKALRRNYNTALAVEASEPMEWSLAVNYARRFLALIEESLVGYTGS